MSAVRSDALPWRAAPARWRAITVDLLPDVLAIETQAYLFPWTRANFIDSIAAGYFTSAMLDEDSRLLGYIVAMSGYEEMHLLNITVAPALEGRGHARAMLARLYAASEAAGALAVWLEVREHNARARGLYLREGFVEVGRRRDYYPGPHGRREDAILMKRPLATAGAAR